jgi:hypothetical protein
LIVHKADAVVLLPFSAVVLAFAAHRWGDRLGL